MKKISLFNKEVAKVQGRFIDLETRVPIVIQGRYVITNIIDINSYNNLQLYDIVKKQYMERYLKEDFTIPTDDEGNELIAIMNENPDRLFGKEIKNIKVAKKISEKGTESLFKLTDSEFNTLKDGQGREILRFKEIDNNIVALVVLDINGNEYTIFVDEKLDEKKGFLNKIKYTYLLLRSK